MSTCHIKIGLRFLSEFKFALAGVDAFGKTKGMSTCRIKIGLRFLSDFKFALAGVDALSDPTHHT